MRVSKTFYEALWRTQNKFLNLAVACAKIARAMNPPERWRASDSLLNQGSNMVSWKKVSV
jgi:hypothetical protein